MEQLISEGATSIPVLDTGTLNGIISNVLPVWLAVPFTSLFSEIIVVLWYSGVQILIFIAALQKIDSSLYEAAKMDGASKWEQFWKITLPTLRPMIDKEDVEEKFKQRLKDQDTEHNGGSYWIGTMGKTSFGNMGGNVGGVRVGGTTGYQSAFSVVGARKYRDFREDKVMGHLEILKKIVDNEEVELIDSVMRSFVSTYVRPEDVNGGKDSDEVAISN